MPTIATRFGRKCYTFECGLHDVFCESLNSFEFNQDGVGCHNASKQEMSLATFRCRPVYIERLAMATLHANVRSRPTEEFLNRRETPGMRPDRGMFTVLRDCIITGVNTQCSEMQ